MKQVLRNERGMALALAIVALVVVGAFIAGALFSGTQEQRVAENVRRVQASFGVAEAGAYDIIRRWTASPDTQHMFTGLVWYPSTNPTSTVLFGRKTDPTRTGSYSGTLYRFNDELYLIDITGQDTMSLAGRIRGGGASQRVGLLSRIRPLQINTRASLTAGGANVIAGNASIDGNDHTPTGWSGCGPLDTARAGLRIEDSATVSVNGHPTILGNPPVLKDPTVSDSTFNTFGDVTYSELVQRANINLAGGQNFATGIAPTTVSGQCETTNPQNWGDPANPTQPCGNYFPIIHIAGDATINGQEGQGMLLVDGSLAVQGGFQFFGIVIVKGSLRTAGGGSTPAHFWGMVMAQDTVALTDTTNNISGDANLLYSKCAVLKALDNTGTGVPMRSRGWVQLF
jgi:type II secretory pathway pseudopilin PulG